MIHLIGVTHRLQGRNAMRQAHGRVSGDSFLRCSPTPLPPARLGSEELPMQPAPCRVRLAAEAAPSWRRFSRGTDGHDGAASTGVARGLSAAVPGPLSDCRERSNSGVADLRDRVGAGPSTTDLMPLGLPKPSGLASSAMAGWQRPGLPRPRPGRSRRPGGRCGRVLCSWALPSLLWPGPRCRRLGVGGRRPQQPPDRAVPVSTAGAACRSVDVARCQPDSWTGLW